MKKKTPIDIEHYESQISGLDEKDASAKLEQLHSEKANSFSFNQHLQFLEIATKHNLGTFVSYLLRYDDDDDSNTFLHYAMNTGNEKMVKVLIENSRDSSIHMQTNDRGELPYDVVDPKIEMKIRNMMKTHFFNVVKQYFDPKRNKYHNTKNEELEQKLNEVEQELTTETLREFHQWINQKLAESKQNVKLELIQYRMQLLSIYFDPTYREYLVELESFSRHCSTLHALYNNKDLIITQKQFILDFSKSTVQSCKDNLLHIAVSAGNLQFIKEILTTIKEEKLTSPPVYGKRLTQIYNEKNSESKIPFELAPESKRDEVAQVMLPYIIEIELWDIFKDHVQTTEIENLKETFKKTLETEKLTLVTYHKLYSELEQKYKDNVPQIHMHLLLSRLFDFLANIRMYVDPTYLELATELTQKKIDLSKIKSLIDTEEYQDTNLENIFMFLTLSLNRQKIKHAYISKDIFERMISKVKNLNQKFRGRTSLLTLLLKLSIEINHPLPYIQILLKKGVDLTPINELYGSLIIAAVQAKDVELLKFVLSNYPDQDINMKTWGKTALQYAVQSDAYELVLTLYEHGANPSITDKNGKTVFDYDCKGDVATFLDLFKKAKAATNGNSVLHIAMEEKLNNQDQVIQALCARGHVYEDKNNEGKTPLDLVNDKQKQTEFAKTIYTSVVINQVYRHVQAMKHKYEKEGDTKSTEVLSSTISDMKETIAPLLDNKSRANIKTSELKEIHDKLTANINKKMNDPTIQKLDARKVLVTIAAILASLLIVTALLWLFTAFRDRVLNTSKGIELLEARNVAQDAASLITVST